MVIAETDLDSFTLTELSNLQSYLDKADSNQIYSTDVEKESASKLRSMIKKAIQKKLVKGYKSFEKLGHI